MGRAPAVLDNVAVRWIGQAIVDWPNAVRGRVAMPHEPLRGDAHVGGVRGVACDNLIQIAALDCRRS
jgi:hypothetical protein